MSGFSQKHKKQIIGGKFHWKLQDWVNQLFIKYDRCAICGSKHDLEPHHVMLVKPFDKAYVDVDNGIVMCKKCHRAYHEKYGDEINAKTLIDFVKK